MKNYLVLYAGGFHGEYFISHIVRNCDKFHYESIHSEEFNKWVYKPFAGVHTNQTDNAIIEASNKHGKSIIGRTHDHKTKRNLPVLFVTAQDPFFIRRAKLAQLLKKTNEYTLTTPEYFICRHLKTYKPTHPPISQQQTTLLLDDVFTLKAKDTIENFFEIEYTHKMEDEIIDYYNTDNHMLDAYFYGWRDATDQQIIDMMHNYCDTIGVKVSHLPTFSPTK